MDPSEVRTSSLIIIEGMESNCGEEKTGDVISDEKETEGPAKYLYSYMLMLMATMEMTLQELPILGQMFVAWDEINLNALNNEFEVAISDIKIIAFKY